MPVRQIFVKMAPFVCQQATQRLHVSVLLATQGPSVNKEVLDGELLMKFLCALSLSPTLSVDKQLKQNLIQNNYYLILLDY